MKKILAILITLLLSACEMSVDSRPTVTLPPEYGMEEAQELLSTFDFRQLEKEIMAKFPSAINNQVSFYYKPVFYQSMAGKGKKMMIKIDVISKEGWEDKENLEKFLENILLAKIEEPNQKSVIDAKDAQHN